MHSTQFLAMVALSSLVLSACGSEAPVSGVGGDTTQTQAGLCGGAPKMYKDDISFHTGEFDVPTGESFECFYTDVTTDQDIAAISGLAEQGEGGHHVIIFYTDTKRSPTHHPCSESEMAGWNQIVGAPGAKATGTEGLIKMPEGLAIKVPAGKQIVVQTHYINTTGAAFKTNDCITLHTTDPAAIKDYANLFVTNDATFTVPPQSPYKSVTTCTLEQDFKTVIQTGHMHEHGTHYKLEQIDDKGNSMSVLYEKQWQPSYAAHPPIIEHPLDKPFLLTKGTKLRQTCEWNNTSPTSLAFPSEMCVGIFYYFPDNGLITCNLEPVPQP
jgi:hypothetical protein